MDVVLKILLQLGANQTAFIQFGLFILTISFLTVVVYGPYFRAYDQRLKETKGADQVAFETQEEAKKIELIYQSRAREINEKITGIFESAKKQAGEKVTAILETAKKAVSASTEAARKDVETQRQNAEKNIESISKDVAAELTKKLTGNA